MVRLPLLNQPFGTLYGVLKNQVAIGQPLTNQQVEQLALAETPLYKSAMIGFSRPLSDKLAFSADATIAHRSPTISPAGLLDPALAQLAAGKEYYATAKFISTNIFKDGNMYIGAFHFAQQETNTQYVLDFKRLQEECAEQPGRNAARRLRGMLRRDRVQRT